MDIAVNAVHPSRLAAVYGYFKTSKFASHPLVLNGLVQSVADATKAAAASAQLPGQ